jgi:hypothetical protein
MKKVTVKDLGKIVYWEDFIKVSREEDSEDLRYDQSNTPIPGYHKRILGLLRRDDRYFIAVALSPKKGKGQPSARAGRGVINQRLRDLLSREGDVNVSDKGVTMIPEVYKDFLYKDMYTTNNLYGSIEPTILDIVLRMLEETDD